MASAIVLLSLVAVVTMTSIWQHRAEPRMRSPLWLAFSVTAMIAFLLVTGALGYRLDKRSRFFADSSWSETVIWSQVGTGVVLIPLAGYFWRRGLRDLDERLRRT